MAQPKKLTLKEALKLWEEKTGEPISEAKKIELMGSQPPIEKIDGSTSQIPLCEKLSLSTNMIERISNLNPLKCLRILSIGRNYLKSLAGVEACAETLEEIWASYNQIEKPSKGVLSCKKLRVLYLANNSIRDWSEIARLSDCPQLVEMVMVGNPIEERYSNTGNQAEWQREVAKKIPQLIKLDGNTIVITEEGDAEGSTTEEVQQ